MEEERRRLEEERKGLEAQRAEYSKKLEKYEEWKCLFEKERDLLTELKEAQKKNAEADTKLRQCKRTLNKIHDLEAATKKERDDFHNMPCFYCAQTVICRYSYRICADHSRLSHTNTTVDSATQTEEVDSD